MTDSLFVRGELCAPYYIFVQCADRCSDSELLLRFGFANYCPTKSLPWAGRYAILASDSQWKMIADDWRYTLWHMPSTRPALQELAQSYDVFACSVGDCDHSFDFVYYQNSRLVRRYVVADPDFRGGKVVENIGEPLPSEAVAFRETDEMKIVLKVAASIGIRTDYSEHDIRVYAP
jgi:hypothetical protein